MLIINSRERLTATFEYTHMPLPFLNHGRPLTALKAQRTSARSVVYDAGVRHASTEESCTLFGAR